MLPLNDKSIFNCPCFVEVDNVTIAKDGTKKLILEVLEDFLSKEEYTLVNSCVYGGPFTRLDQGDPTNKEKKSLLDVVIVSTCLVKHIDKLEIDENLQWTPSRSVKGNLKHEYDYCVT